MMSERRQPREVDGKGRTVRELLGGRKYSIDYYQREYKWQSKQVAELIDDLAKAHAAPLECERHPGVLHQEHRPRGG